MPRWKNNLQTSDKVQSLKRQAVLREAGSAFSKRGYHNTSLDDVAKALQVSKGTLYNYVKDKQEILWEFHRLAGEIGERAFAESQGKGGTGAEMLRNTLVHYIHLLTQEMGACSALVEVDALRPADRVKAVKQRDQFEKAFLDVVKIGIKDGSIRPVDPRLAVFTFMGAINWLPRWFSPTGRLPAETIAHAMTDLLISGLMVHPASASPTSVKTAKTSPGARIRPAANVPRAGAKSRVANKVGDHNKAAPQAASRRKVAVQRP